jgi:hypothetical protein
MTWMGLLLFSVWNFTGCGYERLQKRLDVQEFDHWYALRVYMSEGQRKTYLKYKTKDERDAYLKELGLWDRFYSYSPEEREAIVAGDVQLGWSKDMLEMAWGAPYERKKAIGRAAQRSFVYTYRFEQQPDGSVLVWEPNSKTVYKAARLFVKMVTIDDDVVTEIEEKDASW